MFEVKPVSKECPLTCRNLNPYMDSYAYEFF